MDLKTKHKILKLETLRKKCAVLKRGRKKIAFTNGCFDLLHLGHVSYLQKAKKNDRILVVGLNSDRSVKRLKGEKRPILREEERAAILSALECVDFVVIFDEDTPENVIQKLKPDILIKGADWKGQDIAGAASVKASGGRVEFITFVTGKSTTNIVGKILKAGA